MVFRSILLSSLLGLLLFSCNCKKDLDVPVGLSASEIKAGLRETIVIGSDSVISRLGHYQGFAAGSLTQIPFPQQDSVLVSIMNQTEAGVAKMQELEYLMNRSAERSVKALFPIIKQATDNWDITDPQKILYGDPTDATRFFKMASYEMVYQNFHGIVAQELQSSLATLRWSELVETYLKVPNTPAIQTQLDNYVTNKILEIIFNRLAQEESYIRTIPKAQVTPLLQRIYRFA